MRLLSLGLATGCLLTIFLFGCSGSTRAKEPVTGLVLDVGESLVVTNEFGTYQITATGTIDRRIEWDDHVWEGPYQYRRENPWSTRPSDPRGNGIEHFGAYSPLHVPSNGVIAIAEEGELRITSADTARYEAFLQDANTYNGYAWSGDGYFVRILEGPHPSGSMAINVTIHRLTVDGRTPSGLPPCDDGSVVFAANPEEAISR